jgi:hypothetical protein
VRGQKHLCAHRFESRLSNHICACGLCCLLLDIRYSVCRHGELSDDGVMPLRTRLVPEPCSTRGDASPPSHPPRAKPNRVRSTHLEPHLAAAPRQVVGEPLLALAAGVQVPLAHGSSLGLVVLASRGCGVRREHGRPPHQPALGARALLRELIQVNSRTHVPQGLKCFISLCTNPVSILSVPIQTVR